MQFIIDFTLGFLGVLDLLLDFFFLPLGSLPDLVFSQLGGSGDTFSGTIISGFVSSLITILPGLSDMSLAVIFLGSGLLFVLLWRFLKFLIGLFS